MAELSNWTRGRLILAVAALLGTPVGASVAEADQPVYLLRGDRTSSGWIFLENGGQFAPPTFTMRGGREFVGVLFEPEDPRSIPAVFVKFRDGTSMGAPANLQPGRYRVTLLADGRAAVDIPKFDGGDDVAVDLKQVRSASVRGAATSLGAGLRSVEVRISVGVPSAHRAYLLARPSGDTPTAGEFDICAVQAGGRCPSAPNLLPFWNALSKRVEPSASARDALVVGQGVGGAGTVDLLAVALRD